MSASWLNGRLSWRDGLVVAEAATLPWLLVPRVGWWALPLTFGVCLLLAALLEYGARRPR